MIRMIFLFTFFSFGSLGWALPVTITKNIKIRAVQGDNAVDRGNYVLRSGSVIDIPDEFIVRNSVGDVDLRSTLRNWSANQPENRTYTMRDRRNKALGPEWFFELKVLKAQNGSKLPKGFKGYIALDYLARSRAYSINQEDQNDAADLPKSSGSTANVPIPVPRPQTGGTNIPVPTPRPDRGGDESSIDLSGSSGSQKVTPVAPAQAQPPHPAPQNPRRSKEDILNADDSPAPSVRVLEKGSPVPPADPDTSLKVTPPVRMTPPVPTTEEALAAMKAAAQTLPSAGAADKVCTDGQCEVGLTGTGEEDLLACSQIAEGDFPESLNKIRLTTDGQKKVDASLKWISIVMKNPNQYRESCSFDTKYGILSPGYKGKMELEKFCKSTKGCASDCKLSNMIRDLADYKCRKDSNQLRSKCEKTCNPYKDLDMTHRSDHLKRQFDQISKDIERENPKVANKIKNIGAFDNMDMRLLCLNLRRENVTLKPYARDCSGSGATAFGMGQVQIKTFYETFGITSQRNRSRCINIKLKDLSTKTCPGLQPQFERNDVYWKYKDYTPKEIYDMRSLDVEVQARVSYAVFLNKLYLGKYDLSRTWRGYFGKSSQSSINKIDRCMRTGK